MAPARTVSDRVDIGELRRLVARGQHAKELALYFGVRVSLVSREFPWVPSVRDKTFPSMFDNTDAAFKGRAGEPARCREVEDREWHLQVR